MTSPTCCICGKPANNPYRLIVGGKIIEGCVAKIHDEHLIFASGSARWVSDAKKSFRAAKVVRLTDVGR